MSVSPRNEREEKPSTPNTTRLSLDTDVQRTNTTFSAQQVSKSRRNVSFSARPASAVSTSSEQSDTTSAGSGLLERKRKRKKLPAIFRWLKSQLEQKRAAVDGDQHSPSFATTGRFHEQQRRRSRRGTLARLVGFRSSISIDDVDVNAKREYIEDLSDAANLFRKLAAEDDFMTLERLYFEKEALLFATDEQCWSAFEHAVSAGHLRVMDFCFGHDSDVNRKDKHGNTALHIAIKERQIESLHWLVVHGADTGVANASGEAPIHFCVERDAPQMLDALLSHGRDKVDFDQGDLTHHAHVIQFVAHLNNIECAKVLVKYGATSMQSRCKYGFTPLHTATISKSTEVIDYLLEHGMPPGVTAQEIVNARDKDNNMALHTAVVTGDLGVVKVILKHGACMMKQQTPIPTQEDQSTPLHLACANGCSHLIRAMFDARPQCVPFVLKVCDVQLKTPLHIAAMYDRIDAMELLLDEGADLNARDIEKRTPLLLAASNYAWQAVKVLLERGADVHLFDTEERNILHLAIIFGANVESFTISDKDKAKLYNARDVHGRAPLHYASREGHLVSLSSLIQWGANLFVVDNDAQNPLHFAARYGRYNTCRQLLDSSAGKTILNTVDGYHRSALHCAAENGHVKVVQLLIQRGINPNRDLEQATAVHYAAKMGYTKTLRVLLDAHIHLLNAQTVNGDTALHLAAQNDQAGAISLLLSLECELLYNESDQSYLDFIIDDGFEKSAMALVEHDRFKEALDVCLKDHCVPVLGFIRNLPTACAALFDRCISCSPVLDTKDADYFEKYDFSFLQPSFERLVEFREVGRAISPLAAINIMVDHNRLNLLSHKLVDTFLTAKWRKYGVIIFAGNLLLYASFLICLTLLVTSGLLSPVEHYMDQDAIFNATHARKVGGVGVSASPRMSKEEVVKAEDNPCETDSMVFNFKPLAHDLDYCCYLELIGIVIFVSGNIVKELVQLYRQRMKYFCDASNYLEWVLYIAASIFAFPFLVGFDSHVQWQCGALACFLAWFNLMLFMQRTASVGIYVVMFLAILKTLLRVLMIFVTIIVGFGLSFYILFSQQSGYQTPGVSISSSVIMMLGEINFADRIVRPLTAHDHLLLHYPNLSMVFLLVFVLLMPILIMNLLIGLAVGDIGAIQRDAKLKRMAMQVELHTNIEAKLPDALLKAVIMMEYIHFPNRPCPSEALLSVAHAMSGAKSAASKAFEFGGRLSRYPGCSFEGELISVNEQHKRRLRGLEVKVDKTYELLKLVLQKMEIRSEADVYDDEGDQCARDSQRVMKVANAMATPTRKLETISHVTRAVTALRRATEK